MIKLKGRYFTRSRNWLKKADDRRKQESIGSFIFAWIGFNYYYSKVAFENINQFRDWSRQHHGGRQGDKAEVLFLVHSREFIEFFADCKQRYSQRLNVPIEMPIIDMLRGSHVKGNFLKMLSSKIKRSSLHS